MKLSDLSPSRGSRKRPKIIGRGIGSGHGKTSTRGTKGQLSRSGAKRSPGFEGGTTPLIRKIPKRGFSRGRFQDRMITVNLHTIQSLEGLTKITPETLQELGVVKGKNRRIKLLGEGDIKRSLTVSVHAVSASAQKKIEAAGGKITLIVTPPKESKDGKGSK